MKFSEAVLLVNNLEVKIKANLEEMEMIQELLEIPKYYNSSSLIERFKKTEEKINALIKERAFYKNQIDQNDLQIKEYQETKEKNYVQSEGNQEE